MLVTLETAKAHLRVSDASEDTIVTLYLRAAEDYAVQFLGREVYASAVPLADLTGIVLNASIEAAILLTCGSLYAQREDAVIGFTVAAMPTGSKALLQPYRYGMGL